MKKILFIIFIILILPSLAFGAGTLVVTSDSGDTIKHPFTKQVVREILLTFTAASDNGTIPTLTLGNKTSGINQYYPLTGQILYSAETNPGSTAPTDDYDITITDSDGLDLAGGYLLNRDASTTEKVNIGDSAAHGFSFITGDLTVTISNNSVNSATGTIRLILY